MKMIFLGLLSLICLHLDGQCVTVALVEEECPGVTCGENEYANPDDNCSCTPDVIKASLTAAHFTEYMAASQGDYISIDRAEYDNLLTNLTSFTQWGTLRLPPTSTQSRSDKASILSGSPALTGYPLLVGMQASNIRDFQIITSDPDFSNIEYIGTPNPGPHNINPVHDGVFFLIKNSDMALVDKKYGVRTTTMLQVSGFNGVQGTYDATVLTSESLLPNYVVLVSNIKEWTH